MEPTAWTGKPFAIVPFFGPFPQRHCLTSAEQSHWNVGERSALKFGICSGWLQRTEPWETHFVWSEDTLLVVGLTPVGRATVDRINQPDLA